MGAIAALIGKVGGSMAATNQLRQGDQDLQNNYDTNIKNLYGIDIPDIPIEDQKLYLQQLASTGNFSPQMLQALAMAPSEMQNVQADQSDIQAQANALKQLQDVSTQGMTQADAAAMRQTNRQASSDDIARRKAILNDMAMRGTLGSGAELAAQLDSVQKAQDQEAQQNDKMLQQMQANRLAAIAQTGQLSGQARSQDFGEKSARAQAADAINQFNTQNKQNINNQNVGNQNNAQLYNLQNNQNIANQNVALNNYQQQYNKQLLNQNAQQKFQNELMKQNLINQQNIGSGKAAQQIGQDTAKGIKDTTDLFGGFAGGLGAQ